MDKRGFEMVWSTWVMMILAFMLLLFLVLFFTTGSGKFLDNIRAYLSESNVDSVIQGCNILSAGEEYSFCCDKKEVKYSLNGKRVKGSFSCKELVNQSFINNKIDRNIKCEEINC